MSSAEDINVRRHPHLARTRLAALLTGGVAVGALLTPAVAQAHHVDTYQVQRLSGPDRYATAAAISRAHFFETGIVVHIVSGETFADALAGDPAATRAGGPVLPVTRTSIPDVTEEELRRLSPSRIEVLGGFSAISAEVETALAAYTTGPVNRTAGRNRYQTAAKITRRHFTAPVSHVIIATGTGHADGLAGGAAAADNSSPVLLVEPNAIPDVTADALRSLQPLNITVLGGVNAVSDKVANELRGFTHGHARRIAGSDRFETAARVAEAFWPEQTGSVFLATGRNFPDALAGVPAAYTLSAPLLLTQRDCMPKVTADALERLDPTVVTVLGGTGTVSDAAARGTICEA